MNVQYEESVADGNHGSYRQGYVKFKDFSRTSKKTYTTVFKDCKFIKHTEVHFKI